MTSSADSEVTTRIAEIIALHSPVPHGAHYWRCSYPCVWKYGTQEDHAEHVAAVILASFVLVPKDQLKEERRRINPQTRPKPCDDCGHLKGVHAEPCLISDFRSRNCGCPKHRYTPPNTSWQSRWVGSWKPADD